MLSLDISGPPTTLHSPLAQRPIHTLITFVQASPTIYCHIQPQGPRGFSCVNMNDHRRIRYQRRYLSRMYFPRYHFQFTTVSPMQTGTQRCFFPVSIHHARTARGTRWLCLSPTHPKPPPLVLNPLDRRICRVRLWTTRLHNQQLFSILVHRPPHRRPKVTTRYPLWRVRLNWEIPGIPR